MKTRNIAVTLLACALTLGACKSDKKEDKTGAPSTELLKAGKVLEPEELISKSDAEKLLGEAVRDGKKSETPIVGMKLCMYSAANPSSRGYIQVSLTQDSFMPRESVSSETIYRELKKMFGGSKREVKELGDEAFLATGGLYLFKDGYYIMISSGNTSTNDQKVATLKEAGKTALDKLEKIK